jgi:two-component system phosphate regulon sensor histidine kinase PhoR
MLVTVAAAVWAPAALALGVLYSAGLLPGGAAALTAAVLALFLAFVVKPYLADLLALRGYVEELGHRDEAVPPPFTFHTVPAELCAMIGRLHRNWTKNREDLKAAATASTTVLDRLPDPLILLDRNRKIVRGNIASRDLFGPNIGGRDLSVLRNPEVLAAADQVLAGRDEVAVEVALPVPVERVFLAGITALPTPTSDGTVAILRLQDLTDIKRTEQMRADFVANVSHELKTPLTTLLGYIETLRGPARDDAEARDRFLGIMNQQATRMNSLVEDLLSLSRIELHEHKAPTGRVDLADVLGKAGALFEMRAGAKGQKIALSIAPGPAEALGDPVELSQVFENLIGNSLRYGAPNSSIRIAVRAIPPENGAGSGTIAVSVSDEGAGIPKEHLPRLTERFYRVDAARSRELGGTGLGLAIVKHIVNRHRGDLKIESELGKGSVFTVILPAAGPKA